MEAYKIEQVKPDTKKETLEELKTDNENVKILKSEGIMDFLKCKKTKFEEVVNNKFYKLPVVKIGRTYYSTEKQLVKYLELNDNQYENYRNNILRNSNKSDNYGVVLTKGQLREMFNMCEKKFSKFIQSNQFPCRVIGNSCNTTSRALQNWFFANEGKEIDIKY